MAKDKAKGKAKGQAESEGGITSSYATGDGVKLKVGYSFFGSIYGEEEKQAAWTAMQQDSLTMGPQVANFQKEFAAFCGVKHAFAVANCTVGMHVCTQVFNLKQGDEVIITPTTFVATSLVLLKEKVTPVYADINPRTFNIDPADIAKKVTPKTKAIYVVHYGGQMCDMDPIMEIAKKHNLLVLEDCAHTPGAEYKGRKAGTIGDVGVFSFHSLKNMSTCGEGGMITTNRDDFVEPIEKLRCMNIIEWDPKQTEWTFGKYTLKKVVDGNYKDYWVPSHFDVTDIKGHWGSNYRMNEIQAAVGREQLKKLDKHNEMRRKNGRYINEGIEGLKGVNGVYEDPNCKHIYHLYTITLDPAIYNRDEFLRMLYREYGVQGILHYQPTYHLTGFKKLGIKGNCPNAEKFFYASEFNLPMNPRLTQQMLDDTVEGLVQTAAKLGR